MPLSVVHQQLIHLQVNTVCPAESDDVALVAGGYLDIRGTADDVVFFANGPVVKEVFEDGVGELRCDSPCIRGVAVLR